MAKYPAWTAGTEITADLLLAGLSETAYKTANETVTSSITLQNDNDLLLAVEASAIYRMHLWLVHDSDATAPGDIKIGWTGPSGATMTWGVHGANTATTSSTGVTSVNMQSRAINEVAAFGGGDSSGTIAIAEGLLIVSSTAGTLQMQWAQETSNAVASTVRSGSFLTLTRVN